MKTKKSGPNYGNWVSARFVLVPGTIGLLLLVAACFLPGLAILAVIFLLVAAYFIYARYLFAPNGKNLQMKIWELLLNHLDWDGKGQALDIGCGNGPLVIALAKKYPKGLINGVDYWGKNWAYSQAMCENNARLEGVENNVKFQKASASQLPFPDGSIDAVVSNLTFHEVPGQVNKRELLREALRVVKKGGPFVFQDLFLVEPYYGKMDDLLETIQDWGIQQVKFIETRNEAFIPKVLKLPFMLGTVGILVGKK